MGKRYITPKIEKDLLNILIRYHVAANGTDVRARAAVEGVLFDYVNDLLRERIDICENCGGWLRAGECENCNSPYKETK